MKTANIENWSMHLDGNPFMAPELRTKVLFGNVYNHPKFEDGTYISTSSLQEFSLKSGKAVTRNTVYGLGKIDKEYLAYCEKEKFKDLELLRKYKGE